VALFLGRMWDLISGRWRGRRRRRTILAQLDNLSASEAQLLAHQVTINEQTFNAAVDSPVVVGLRRKGLLARPAGIGNPFEYPHLIPDFVWTELRRRWPDRGQPEAPPVDARSGVLRARAGVSARRGGWDRGRGSCKGATGR